MTREEAIEVISQDIPCEHDADLIEALNMAIQALEQLTSYERTINKLTEAISEQATILDKIRAEVIEKAKCTMNDTRAEGLYMALQIIDKYRGEEDETDN